MARVILLTDFSEAYSRSLLKGIMQYSKHHTPWVLCKMPLSFRDLYHTKGVVEWAKKWDADAIIGQFYNSDPVHLFKENGIIAIAQDFKSRFTEIPNITGNHIMAGRMGAEYFIKKGFKNFAFYGFKGIVWSQERCDGFRERIAYQPGANFQVYQNDDFTDLWYYDSVPLINWLKSLPKPVAVMACDDNQAHHITEACQLCNIKIPEELSLLGVDNDETICSLSDPPLTSILQAVEKGGYEAAALIDKLLQNPDIPYEAVVVHPTHIITRQSTNIYSTNDSCIATVLKYIHTNAEEKIQIGHLLQLVPLSRRLLETRFKEVTKLSIYAYIINLRMERLAQKLLESNAPIVEIVRDMGFADYNNISRQFKQIKGCTPSEYRLHYSLKI